MDSSQCLLVVTIGILMMTSITKANEAPSKACLDGVQKCLLDYTSAAFEFLQDKNQQQSKACGFIKTFLKCMVNAPCGEKAEEQLNQVLAQVRQGVKEHGFDCPELDNFTFSQRNTAGATTVAASAVFLLVAMGLAV